MYDITGVVTTFLGPSLKKSVLIFKESALGVTGQCVVQVKHLATVAVRCEVVHQEGTDPEKRLTCSLLHNQEVDLTLASDLEALIGE